jgi:tRNA-splicing ligase RtcB
MRSAWEVPMKIFGQHDANTLAQMTKVAERAAYTALMADGHMGYVMPIGGVAAYRGEVSINGVGVDIACGNCAIQTHLRADSLRPYLEEYADEIVGTIGFGMARPTNQADDAPVDHPLFDSPVWDLYPSPLRRNLRERARAQLGTVGGGNHYVDVFEDQHGYVWVGVHFGSRGLGFITAHGFATWAQGGLWATLNPRPPRGMDLEMLLPLDTYLGGDYWHAMTLAGEYAYAGREWVANKVVSILGGYAVDTVHNHHNFAWKEDHFEENLIVVRKGATPAEPGQRGFVGGSMGDISVILRGSYVLSIDAHQSMYSTVHGAGRVMGRMAAKGKWKKGACLRPGLVSREMMTEATKGVVLRGGDLDEAPQVYRPLASVLEAQGPTITVEHVLRPLIVCMAPSRTVDPYKD